MDDGAGSSRICPRQRQLTVDEDTGNKNQKAQQIPLQQVKRWMEGQWTEGGSLSTRFMQIVALSVRSSSTLRFAAVRFLTICSRSVFIRRWLPLISVSVHVPYSPPTTPLRTHVIYNAEALGRSTDRLCQVHRNKNGDLPRSMDWMDPGAMLATCSTTPPHHCADVFAS